MHSGTECLVHEMGGFSVGYAFDFRYAMELVVAHMAKIVAKARAPPRGMGVAANAQALPHCHSSNVRAYKDASL